MTGKSRPLIAVFAILCVAATLTVFLRHNAFPGDKRLAQEIERAAYPAQNQGTNRDYCIPDSALPACSGTFLESVPAGTACFAPRCAWGRVTHLSLAGAQLDEMPADLVRLSGLVVLDLHGNDLRTLPPQIGKLAHLRRLDLSGNRLTSLPPEIGQLRNLEYLDLSGNQLTDLPPEIGQLENLASMDLSGNRLNRLRAEIGQLAHLTVLRLSNNQLSGPLPGFLTNLSLNSLEFSNSGLCVPAESGFQKWIQGVPHAEYSRHALCSLAPGDEVAMRALYDAGASAADWDSNTLPCTWSGVGCDPAGHIVTLDIHSSEMRLLPPEIGLLTHLQFLRLSYSSLRELPPEIGSLGSLAYLELMHNQMVSLPSTIGQLENLRTLMLTSNRLTRLPLELGKLHGLEYLDVSDNPLSGPLPSFLTGLPKVRFIFENTGLCVSGDEVTLNWLRRQATGYYDAASGTLVYVPPDPEALIRGYREQRGCR